MFGGTGLMASECEQSFATSKDLEALVAGANDFSQQSVSFVKVDDARTVSQAPEQFHHHDVVNETEMSGGEAFMAYVSRNDESDSD
jgi:hypothetical protein